MQKRRETRGAWQVEKARGQWGWTQEWTDATAPDSEGVETRRVRKAKGSGRKITGEIRQQARQ
jgi:hypothetical protein